MPKQLIHTDQSMRDGTASVYAAAKSRVQAVVTLYNTMSLPVLTAQEFPRLFNDTASLIFDKATGGSLTLQGVQLDKAKAMKIIVKPAGYAGLVAAIASLREDAPKGITAVGNNERISFTVADIGSLFALGTNSTVNYTTLAQSQIDEAGKYYVESDRAKAVFAFSQAVVAAYFSNGLHTLFPEHAAAGTHSRPIPDLIASSINYINSSNQTYTVAYRELINKYDR